MSVPNPQLPNQAAPLSLADLREALAFVTEMHAKAYDAGASVFEWLWEAIQGDFNGERSTGQIVFDTAISIIPGVDQVCDVRDIVANCKHINEDRSNTWAWVSLGLTLIGLFPSLGSLLKGVLKIFFLFVRRSGGKALMKAVDEAMTWVITLLRKREVQKYWKALKWDCLFHELAEHTRKVRGKVNVGTLLQAFDRGIALMGNLIGYVRHIPFVGSSAETTFDMVRGIRNTANQHLGKAVKPLQDVLDKVIQRLEIEDLVQRRGILDTGNIHFTGGLPETRAVTLMREADPPPSWLSRGKPTKNASVDLGDWREIVDEGAQDGYPKLSNAEIASFTKGMRADELVGPQRLYRVVSPNNMAASADWVTEEVWKKIMSSPDPKAAWRKYMGVWPDWNPDGQFVIYDLKPGETLKVYRGPAAAQVKPPKANLDAHLEGGWEQIKFHTGSPNDGHFGDTVACYRKHADGRLTPTDMTYGQYRSLPPTEQEQYQFLREKINHPDVLGPFDTGWGYTDFDAQMIDARLGLPALPGQITNVKH